MMKRLKLTMLILGMLLLLAVSIQAANPGTLSWTSPNTNTDGSPLTDLAGFNIYCGTSAGTYTIKKPLGVVNSVAVSSVITSNGTFYCAATAFDTSGNESAKSNEISFLVDTLAPAAPTGLKAQ